MASELEIKEKFSRYWRTLTALLALISLLFFIAYWIQSDPFWGGIFRLISFICFAGAVIGGLKVMEGQHSIQLQLENGHLGVRFFKKGEELQHDLFELDNIANVRIESIPTYFSDQLTYNGYSVVLELKDSDRPLQLIELNSRTLSISREDASEIVEFLGDCDIPVEKNSTQNNHKDSGEP